MLKHAGVGQQHLVKPYCTLIRPALEYEVYTWHRGPAEFQADQIERVQKQVLHIILPDSSYRNALLATGLQILVERHIDLCGRFATHLMVDPELHTWLPPIHRPRGGAFWLYFVYWGCAALTGMFFTISVWGGCCFQAQQSVLILV